MIVSNGSALSFAPQALGETTPSLSNGYFYASGGLSIDGRFATYSHLYKAQPSIATLVDKVSVAAARLRVKVWDTTAAAGKTVDTTSAFAKLIAQPCAPDGRILPSTDGPLPPTKSTARRSGTSSAPAATLSAAHLARSSTCCPCIPRALPSSATRPALSGTSSRSGTASAGILTAPAEDVVAFLRYNPDTLMRGLSRLEPLRSTLANEDAARRATGSFWDRGARPSLVLTTPDVIGTDESAGLRHRLTHGTPALIGWAARSSSRRA